MNIEAMGENLVTEAQIECLTADFMAIKTSLTDMSQLDRLGDLAERLIELGRANRKDWDSLTKDEP